MAHCSQLSINEREEISLGLAQKFSKNYIALRLDHVFCSKRCAKRVWAQRNNLER